MTTNILELLVLSKKAVAAAPRKTGPGSRGGKFYRDAKGVIRYGEPPKGKDQKKTAAASNGKAKPKPAPVDDRQTLAKQRMVDQIKKLVKSGKDAHGKPLSQADRDKLDLLVISLRKTAKKELAAEITEKAADRLPFTVFKDKKGQWRWVGISSSAAQDGDGETVSLKALEEDTALKDITGDYGPLNFWHTNIKIGTCDFNAMDGPLLVESGTFVSDGVAVAVAKAINEKVFQPGMSLEFEHNEHGPPVLPGRVFSKINKVGRALLPAEKASNLLTRFQVYSSNGAALAEIKDSKKMLTEEKQKKALEVFGQEMLEALSSGNQVAIKMAEALNLSFKAMQPSVAEVAPVVEVAAPVGVSEAPPVNTTVSQPFFMRDGRAYIGGPVETQPAPPVTLGTNTPTVAVAPVVEPIAPAPVEESEVEGEEIDADALFENLANSVAGKVFAMQQTAQATATKEVSDVMAANTIAMKEVTTALNTVVAENKSLKARLDALEGIQPAAVRARASQGGGVPLESLPADMQQIVNSEKENKDPYAWATPLFPGLERAPRG